MLAPTFAPCVLTFTPYILTFGPCACGVSLLSTGANIPLAQVVVVTSCNLRSWCFFTQPLAQIVHLHTWWYHPLQLALVVLFHPATGANTALAPGQLALCGGIIYIIIYIYISSDLGHGANLCRVLNGQDGRPLRSHYVRLKYSPRIASKEKKIVRNKADTPTSPSGKDTEIGIRNQPNYSSSTLKNFTGP